MLGLEAQRSNVGCEFEAVKRLKSKRLVYFEDKPRFAPRLPAWGASNFGAGAVGVVLLNALVRDARKNAPVIPARRKILRQIKRVIDSFPL